MMKEPTTRLQAKGMGKTARARAERCIPAPILEKYGPLVEKFGTPLYVYDEKTMHDNIDTIQGTVPARIYLAAFAAGAIPALLALCNDRIKNGGMMCNSLAEVEIARKHAGIAPERLLFAAFGLPPDVISKLVDEKIYMNLSSLSQVASLASAGGEECGLRVRLNVEPPPGTYAAAVGRHGRSGVPEHYVAEVMREAQKMRVRITGLHIYVGSNILDYAELLRLFDHFLAFIEKLPAELRKQLQTINVGGGFGVDYTGLLPDFNFKAYGEGVAERLSKLKDICSKTITIAMEPGRFILAKAGVLLVRITDVEHYKPAEGYEDYEHMDEVDVDSSCALFPRYWIHHSRETREEGRQRGHFIVAIERLDEPATFEAMIGGRTTLSADFLGEAVLPPVKAGDLLAVTYAGAYGYGMRSQFLGQPWPAVVLLKEGENGIMTAEVIARRQDVEHMTGLFNINEPRILLR